jgi:hypothetical protein
VRQQAAKHVRGVYGALMGRVNLSSKVVAALRSAGATEEIIAGARQILGACASGPVGRPRIYKNRAEADRAYKLRRKEREKTREIISTPIEAVRREEYHEPGAMIGARQRLLLDAAQGHVDPAADIAPIQAFVPWPPASQNPNTPWPPEGPLPPSADGQSLRYHLYAIERSPV